MCHVHACGTYWNLKVLDATTQLMTEGNRSVQLEVELINPSH